GVIRSRAREELEKWLRELEESRRVLLVERETAQFYADIVADLRSRGCMIRMNDVWIAALALQHDLPVLARDEHFDQVKRLRRIPW
ncbi:MAG: PIN domain-containing protein, partial [Verrucomicrobia bacterium]|nr:PIN domain-containing protein [Verrucomicrobiota bacterium]